MSRLPGTKVFLGNLPDECDNDKLKEMLESVGPLAEFDVIKNYGFAHYESEDDAMRAVQDLNGADFEGCNIRVEQSRSSVRHKPGMGSMTECYRCGKDGHWSKDCLGSGDSRGRGRGRGRGFGRGRGRGGYDRDHPYGPPPPSYRDPYDDPYADPYYRRRLPPPHPYDRYHPYDLYERRRLAAYRDSLYDLERDPYARPPADYYERLAAREAYYDYYARRRYAEEAAAASAYPPGPKDGYPPPPPRPAAPDAPPPRSRVPGPF